MRSLLGVFRNSLFGRLGWLRGLLCGFAEVAMVKPCSRGVHPVEIWGFAKRSLLFSGFCLHFNAK